MGSDHVVVEVFGRVLHRFADGLISGKVHDIGDLVIAAHLSDELAIGDVAHHEWNVIDRCAMPELEAVENDDVEATFDE